jgi:general secretion pathway protein I
MKRDGFTLLEVVVAMAILGISLLAIFDLNGGAVNSHAYTKRLSVATMLARSKMTDLEQDLYDKGFDTDDLEQSGDFRAEGWEAFTWKAQILAPRTTNISPDKLIEALFNVPAGPGGGMAGLAALFAGGRDGGVGSSLASIPGLSSLAGAAGASASSLPPGATGATGLAALGPMAGLAQQQMTVLLDQIQKGVRQVHLTVSWKDGKRTESIDLVTHVVSLRQGSDRNGTPGAPLSAAAPGAPGTPVIPGVPGVPGSFGTQGTPFFGPTRGNTPQGTPLDPYGRPIRQ